MFFADRFEAGRLLAALLGEYADDRETIVLALPRGGVPVGFEIAAALRLALDVLVVRKLGVPGQPELALGAIASGGIRVINQDVVEAFSLSPESIERIAATEEAELERRERAYRGDRAPREVGGRSVFLVDDGLATGYTMRAAVAALRQEHPKRIVVAVPVAARSTCEELDKEADAALCLFTPFEFVAVGQWYRNFAQTSDDEVRALLELAANQAGRYAA